jgi:hypothetical protein
MRLVINQNTAPNPSDPAKYHTYLHHDDGSESRLTLAGFSYFGEIGGLRHIPADGHVVLYPDRNGDDWDRVLKQSSSDSHIRLTFAEWLAMLADFHVNLARVWVFDANEADSYPFFHLFDAEQYNLDVASSRYLRRLVRFIDLARKHGIIVHLTLSSDQMLRPNMWGFMPFNPAHAQNKPGGGDYFTTAPLSFLDLNDANRQRIEREMVRSLTTAVKPYWNVMFEVMNEACVTAPVASVSPWCAAVAGWLAEDLKDANGNRTHLITVSVADGARGSIVAAVKPDIISLHGNQWGGNDALGDPTQTDADIISLTSNNITTLYGAFPNRKFAVICDSDSFPRAQHDPQRFAAIALGLKLNYAHRWHSDFLSHHLLAQQLQAFSQGVPAGLAFPDSGPRPAPIPVVTTEESAVAGSWVARPGVGARDIGIFRRDSVWVIGNTPTGGGFTIHHWNGSAWTAIDGGAVRIAVGPDGLPWVVNTANQIFHRTSSGWTPVAGAARDIGVGGDGTVWIIGTTAVSGGFEIFRRDGNAWTKVDGGGVRIAVNPVGEPWTVNDANQIFARDDNAWIQAPGTALDISVGLDDTTWIVGTNPIGNGTGFWYWLGTQWRDIDGGGISIAVDEDGLPWAVNAAFNVFQRVAPD